MNLLSKATLGLVAGGTALTVAAPAEAQYRYRHYDRGGGDVAAGALIGGIAGLAIGAAIADNNRGGYYDRRYYDYGPRYRYAPRRYYNPRRAYRQRCVRRVYDPYIGRRVRVRYC